MVNDDIIRQFKDLAELQVFCESQHRTINELSKRMVQLEDENKHLKSLLEDTVDDSSYASPNLEFTKDTKNDALIICATEVAKLREQSMTRQLSSDEVKRLDILVKNYMMLTTQEKKKEDVAQTMSSSELLRLIENE